MKIKRKNIKNSLNNSHKKLKPLTSDIEKFVANLKKYFNKLDETESEENAKINLINLLNVTYYLDNYYINTKERADLVIHTDNTTKSSVGVIIETKRINSPDFPTVDNLNTKAFHQLILYYLRERTEHNNLNIKNLIITDFYRWFIFDAIVFEKLFFQNKSLRKDYEQWKNNEKVRTDTNLFYNDIAKPLITNLQDEIEFTFFDLNHYKEKPDNTQIINLYKILSPVFLLKEKQKNDNNTLNSKFYNELLHIIGLQEVTEGNKKVLKRKENGNSGSLIENTIRKLKIHNNLKIIPNIEQYGETLEERLFGIALELCINWLNRILFLKLLEAQIVKYHNQKKEYYFLTSEKITQFEQLDRLFFEVLAVKPQNRDNTYKGLFEHIPYLNSSLFEPTNIERYTIYIDNLYDDFEHQTFSNTILKDNNDNKLNTKLPTLKYLLDFLNAYNFSSDSSELTIDYSNTLINSSVLGLIFEKINGYKDGAYFTPSYITMYMCRETIRKAVINKFRTSNLEGFENLQAFNDLFKKIDSIPILKANEIINSITICDPAVGSGHFLVSSLNELISIKSDLKVLCDNEGKRLKTYRIENINDELVILDEDNKEFEYTLTDSNKINPEKQRVQETLFNEKKQIIENCLFGVDINPNSVNITRLRLWIELLKNAYYTTESNYSELQTLPNIDINIKHGNSLLSRFALNADLKKALSGTKWNLFTYINAVNAYKEPIDKEAKKQIAQLISDIKQTFKSEISTQDPRYKKLQKLKSELYNKTTVKLLDVELKKEDRTKETHQLLDYEAQIKQIETELEDEKSGVAYQNAFEWRFEFPEVLDENGEFIGFDVVIGNPPYFQLQYADFDFSLLKNKYEVFRETGDIYALFVELGITILKADAGLSYIVSNRFCTTNYGSSLRKYLSKFQLQNVINMNEISVFDKANVGTLIFSLKNTEKQNNNVNIIEITDSKILPKLYEQNLDFIKINQDYLGEEQWLFVPETYYSITNKMKKKGTPLCEITDLKINRGITTGANKYFVIDYETKNKIIGDNKQSGKIIKPLLKGRNIKRYNVLDYNEWIIFTRRGVNIENYPAILKYLGQYKEQLTPGKGRKDGNYNWFEIQDNTAFFKEFEKEKLIWTRLSATNAFAISTEKEYAIDSTSFATGKNLKYYCAVLNSKAVFFYFKLGSVIWGKNGIKWFGSYFDSIPIPQPNNEILQKIEPIVQKIVTLKKENPQVDTSKLERQIDKLVYKLYGFTKEEIEIIENFYENR